LGSGIFGFGRVLGSGVFGFGRALGSGIFGFGCSSSLISFNRRSSLRGVRGVPAGVCDMFMRE
jgi:hypothetical protein